jgi:hypothetical protein
MSILVNTSISLLLLVFLNGCSQTQYKFSNNFNSKINNSKSILVYTPDVHVMEVEASDITENIALTKKTIKNFKNSFKKVFSKKFNITHDKFNTCYILSKDTSCTNNLIIESRNNLSSIPKDSTFNYKLNNNLIKQFKKYDLLVYIKVIEFDKTFGKHLSEFGLNILSAIGGLGIIRTTHYKDNVKFLIYDIKTNKLIWYDTLTYNNTDFRDKNNVDDIINLFFSNIKNINKKTIK